MPRTILVHLNVELHGDEPLPRTPDQVADAITQAVSRGDLFHDFDRAEITVALAEEV